MWSDLQLKFSTTITQITKILETILESDYFPLEETISHNLVEKYGKLYYDHQKLKEKYETLLKSQTNPLSNGITNGITNINKTENLTNRHELIGCDCLGPEFCFLCETN